MEISKTDFFSAAAKAGLSTQQIEKMWEDLEDKRSKSNAFVQVLYYFGAMVVISALTWFMGLGWMWFGGGGIFLISMIYAGLLVLVGSYLWKNEQYRTPAGLLITIAVCLVPLAIYGLEVFFNVWPDGENPGKYQDFYSRIKGSWVFMEIGTILAGLLALRYFSFPFLTAPIFFAAWFLTMDIIPLVFGTELQWEHRCWVTLILGAALLAIGYTIDRKGMNDYSFWSYLFGAFSFWGALTCLMWDRGELILFCYLLINIVLMFLSILLQRRILMIMGAIGVFTYLGHLAYDIFKDSIAFPFVLSFFGLAIIYLGILYQKNIDWIEKTLVSKLPESIRKYF